jgi:hypothetical protein
MLKRKEMGKKHELVRLPYRFKFEKQFKKPCKEWLDMIETMCNEILGNYTKKEDQLMTAAFGTCWGLVLKCYESRTRQHKMLNIKTLRPLNHYFPSDIMDFGRRS